MLNFNFNYITNQEQQKLQKKSNNDQIQEKQNQENNNNPPIINFIKEQTTQFNNNNKNNNSLENSPISNKSVENLENFKNDQDFQFDNEDQNKNEIDNQSQFNNNINNRKLDNLEKPFMHKYKIQKVLNNGQKNRKRTASQNNIQKGQNQVKKVKIKQPFLPDINPQFEYTLVLDLDKTLIFSEQVGNAKKYDAYITYFRPNLIQFLKEVSQYFEIVIFTAAEQDYADSIINHFDQENQFIKHRLYKQHMKCITKENQEGEVIQIFFKDLSCLGRNLKKTILVDDLQQNFRKQPNNGILIPEWKNDNLDDQHLINLASYLKQIQKENKEITKDFGFQNQKIFQNYQTQN